VNGGISVKEAARLLGRSPGALRRWVRDGAPCVTFSGGQGGRNRGSLVDPAALAKWHAQRHGIVSTGEGSSLARLAALLRGFHRSDALDGVTAARLCGIDEQAAAKYLLLFFRFVFLQTHGRPPEPKEYPGEVKNLIALTSSRE